MARGHNHLHGLIQDPYDAAELERLVELGARAVTNHPHFVVLADPEGNEFCLLR